MDKFTSLAGFNGFRERVLEEAERNGDRRSRLVVSAGTCGQASGSNDIMRIIKRLILERGLQSQLSLRVTGCQGFCEMNPFILVEPGMHFYPKLRMEDVPEIIEATLADTVAERLLYRDPGSGEICRSQHDIPFFSKQKLINIAM